MDQILSPLIAHARETSPYFKSLYSELPSAASLSQLPLVDHAEYWEASNRDRRSVMTGPQVDGVVMKTGGTTSRPKTTAYSQSDLQRTTHLLANGLLAGGIRAGDRIANMFYAGDLYASFLLHVLSINALPVPAVHLPIGGLTAAPEAAALLEQCEATALLTTATSLVKLAIYITSIGEPHERIRCVLFGGEPLFPEQERIIRTAFPRATIKSCVYGSVDAGVLAVAAPGDDTRVHQALSESVMLEICKNDGSGTPIEENGVPGVIVATNTTRQLCPVIRYPTGDSAAWVDRTKSVFRLLGRAGQAVRLGPVSIDMVDLRAIVAYCTPGLLIQGVQAVVSRANGLDQLECVVATPGKVEEPMCDAIRLELYRQRPMLKQHVGLGLVAPILVSFVDVGELQLTSGSAKLMEIVEQRFDTRADARGKKRKSEDLTD